MDVEHVLRIISNGEGLSVEFKKATSELPKNLFEVIVPVIKITTKDNVTNKRHLIILTSIHSNNKIKIDELATKLKVSKRTIIRDLHEIRQKKVLTRIGNNKTGFW